MVNVFPQVPKPLGVWLSPEAGSYGSLQGSPARCWAAGEPQGGAHLNQAFLDDVAAMTTLAASDNLEAIEKTEVKPEA